MGSCTGSESEQKQVVTCDYLEEVLLEGPYEHSLMLVLLASPLVLMAVTLGV